MAAPASWAARARRLALPARRLAVVDPGSERIKLLLAELHGAEVRVIARRLVDLHEEPEADEADASAWISPWLAEVAPDALVLVLPQGQAFHRVVDDPGAGRAAAGVLAEAARIEELTGVRMASAATPLAPFAGHQAPLAATFWRAQAVQEWADAHGAAEVPPFELVPGAAALAAAHLALPGAAESAVLVDLGARQTTFVVLAGGQLVHAVALPEGSRPWTDAVATDRGCTRGSAEVLKRAEDLFIAGPGEKLGAAVLDWLRDIEQALADWADDLPQRSGIEPARWPVFLAGGGAAQPGLLGHLRAHSRLDWRPWAAGDAEAATFAPALGALARAVGDPPGTASALPEEARRLWRRETAWRVLTFVNALLLALLAVALGWSITAKARRAAARDAWMAAAGRGLADAQAARAAAVDLNREFELWRPLLLRQRQSRETVEALAALRRERTNDAFWYVLVGDLESYLRGGALWAAATNRAEESPPRIGPPPPPGLLPARALVAEAGFLPQGEEMRQALSELVGRLQASPPFRNVDVLPAESRRALVATNLAYPDRFFALELSLSDTDLLPPIALPSKSATNGLPRAPGRGFSSGPGARTRTP
ncbi:MAG: hypothetical protein ACKVYV_04680 [Limisphaerales bacterium]